MSKPKESDLNRIFDHMVDALDKKLLQGEECPVSAISAAMQLLRDNDISCDPDEINHPNQVREKLKLLPFPTEDEEGEVEHG